LLFFSPPPPSLAAASLFLSGRTDTGIRERIGKLKGSIAEKATEKGGMYKGWVHIFAKEHSHGRAHRNAARAIRETTISLLAAQRNQCLCQFLNYSRVAAFAALTSETVLG